jgi:hypothetical protein
MSPAEELSALYDQWRRLTETEGQAIEAADWNQVAQCQSGKSRLQPRIVEVGQRLEVAVHELHFRPIVERLIEMERANRTRLQAQRETAEGQKRHLDRSSRCLRQLHESYVPPIRPHWESYS